MNFLKRNRDTDHEKQRKTYALPDNQEVIFNTNSLVPVVLQHLHTKEVLHLGYMDQLALRSSLERRVVYLYRRSKGRLEAFGSRNKLEFSIESVKLDKTHRSLLMLILPNHKTESEIAELHSFTRDVQIG